MLGSFYCTTNTFVLEFANNRVWRVKQGSGMGLRHSGDLADLSMYNLCEKVWALSTDVATDCGIKNILAI